MSSLYCTNTEICASSSNSFCGEEREVMGLEESHLHLVIYDAFRGQQIPMVRDVLSKSNVNVPANCINKLQPLDLSISLLRRK